MSTDTVLDREEAEFWDSERRWGDSLEKLAGGDIPPVDDDDAGGFGLG
jgi:hypothetical protein